jgi:hypothetical protein
MWAPCPYIHPFSKTSSLSFWSIRAPFLTPFTPMGSRLPHLHNDTLGYSFHSGAPRDPFWHPGHRYTSPFHISLSSKCYICFIIILFHFRYLMFVCAGTWYNNIQPTVIGTLWPLQVYIQNWHALTPSAHNCISKLHPLKFILRIPTPDVWYHHLHCILVLSTGSILTSMSCPTYIYPLAY